MFNKLVAIEPVSLIPSAEEALHQYAKEVVLYRDIPASDDQIVQRIGDADAVLLSYTSRMGKNVIERCPNIRYIGMCCSLYDTFTVPSAAHLADCISTRLSPARILCARMTALTSASSV